MLAARFSLSVALKQAKSPCFRLGVARLSDSTSIGNEADATTPVIPHFKQPLDASAYPALSLATSSNMELLNHRRAMAVEKYQAHPTDTGSAPVQIAVMTEKILNLAKHGIRHGKDKHSMRGYQILLAKRKKMMKYLKKKDMELFKATVKAVGLEKEASNLK